MPTPLFADVALKLPLSKTYQYAVPKKMLSQACVGRICRVPLRNTRANGCIVSLGSKKKCPFPKPIHKILTPDFSVPPPLMDLAHWISDYYFCSLGEALSCVSFIGFNDCKKRLEKWVRLRDPSRFKTPESLDSLSSRQSETVRYFLLNHLEEIKLNPLLKCLNLSRSVIQNLIKKNILELFDVALFRKDGYEEHLVASSPLPLNEFQKSAFEPIKSAVSKRIYKTFLLNGITGSGKTEIYLQALDLVIKNGSQGIVLVPEIALTPQTLERFRSRFGDKIGVYHSQLTLGQKYDLWHRIKQGETQCLVGARSALFAPFPRLGLIVVDEEHESTYKQNETPRYHARDVAVMRARCENAVVILGSATPSLESFYNAQIGKFTLLTLPERIEKAPLPTVRLIDMTAEIAHKKTTGIFSRELLGAVQKRLENREQVILFLNRRGFANFLMCPSCRKAVECEHCSVTMTYHSVGNRLVCHYCGEMKAAFKTCPYCGYENLMQLGIGTQRLEQELSEKFPAARILRMDSDSLGSRKVFLQKWKAITAGEVDILFGTQILAKGFDLAPVTLVGVISADHSLFLPDFRSAERTFSLLTQVAGRAGRGNIPGEVIIQTFLPKHYSIVDALSQDYNVFANRELKNRKALRFPPYFRLISVLFTGKNPKIVPERIRRFSNLLRVFRNQLRLKNVSVLGPASSPISKIGDQYRYRLLVRGEKMSQMRCLIQMGLDKYHSLKLKHPCRITIDVDPTDLL